MDPNEARGRLLQQHEQLRELLGRALVTADHYIAGRPVAQAFTEQLMEIRRAFSEHNELEQQLLEPLLGTSGAWGPARIARMLEEHSHEHVAFTDFLARPLSELARLLGDFVEEIEAHMAAEERTFLSPAVAKQMTTPAPE